MRDPGQAEQPGRARPVTDAILDRVLRTAAEKAAEPGQLRFTERQLYYEVCRVLMPWHRAPRRAQFTSAPALTYDAYLAALRRRGPGSVNGLLPPVVPKPRQAAGRHTPEPDLFDYGLPRLLVCESDDIAAMLRANGVPMESACPVYGAGELPLEEGVLRMLSLAERATVYLLHDASARGLTFPARFARSVDVPDGVRVVPLGLRPRQAGALHLVHGRGPAYAAVPAAFHTAGSGTGRGPGAGQGPGQGLAFELGRRERDWLRRGRFVEVAAVNPASLLRTVHRLVREVRTPRSQLTELRQVRRAGFLSWPTA
ncbi:hypothetical protein [Streptomyces sp. NP-1717]|uniref:hypothetical protein n=1 Tax=Streptomyces sp. NP-1717 TaxID=2704470 RepID=UPI001F5CAE85|nr:hypothetical protein [Streptomyces sp. NP-1717]MCI3223309.1 hypothetical protein [Streptomyces sp. NP-1717]